jgi:hypothetical protein
MNRTPYVTSYSKVLLLATVLTISPATAGGAAVTFEDAEFSPTNWTGAKALDQGAGNSFASEQAAEDGNPGAFFTTTINLGTGDPQNGHGLSVAYIRTGAVYSPGQQGPIKQIEYSIDVTFLGSESPDDKFPPKGTGYYPLLKQGNLFYVYINPDEVCSGDRNGDWVTCTYSETGDSQWWTRVDGGSGSPNFTAAGAPIQFGFLDSVGWGDPARLRRRCGIDNWAVAVTGAAADGPNLAGSWRDPLVLNCAPKPSRRAKQCTLESLTVRNDGTKKAKASKVSIYLSQNNVFDAGDPKVGSLRVKALKAGASKVFTLKFNLPPGIKPGEASGLFVIAVVDAKKKVTETDEADNVVVSTSVP